MSISFSEYINEDENNRVEFLFDNFDFFDGNDLTVKILNEKCGVEIGEKIDGIWYTIIPLHYNGDEFKLVWHEDVGNYIYSESKEDESIKKMRKLVQIAVDELTQIIK